MAPMPAPADARAPGRGQRPATGPRPGAGPAGPPGNGPHAAAWADQLLASMAAIRRRGRRLAGRPAELSPLTGAQLELVRLLRRRPAVSVAEAAEELDLAPNTVSTLVGRLGEAGLVRRRVDRSDRRVARLELTPDMRRKVDAWRDRRVLHLASAIGRLSKQDQRRLGEVLPVLARLAEELETTQGAGGRAPGPAGRTP